MSIAEVISGLHFDEAEHRYYLDGRELPSVTSVLAAAGLTDWTFAPEYARDRGTLVHKAVHLALTTGLDWSSVDESFHPYINAALAAKRELGIEVIESERRIVSRTYGYAGTMDWLCHFEGRSIIDLKTGPLVPAYALQLAAYAEAYREETGLFVRRRFGLRLHADGEYEIHQYTNRSDFDDFAAALRVANWKKENA